VNHRTGRHEIGVPRAAALDGTGVRVGRGPLADWPSRGGRTRAREDHGRRPARISLRWHALGDGGRQDGPIPRPLRWPSLDRVLRVIRIPTGAPRARLGRSRREPLVAQVSGRCVRVLKTSGADAVRRAVHPAVPCRLRGEQHRVRTGWAHVGRRRARGWRARSHRRHRAWCAGHPRGCGSEPALGGRVESDAGAPAFTTSDS